MKKGGREKKRKGKERTSLFAFSFLNFSTSVFVFESFSFIAANYGSKKEKKKSQNIAHKFKMKVNRI